jgi:hypothetical protein
MYETPGMTVLGLDPPQGTGISTLIMCCDVMVWHS